MDAPTSTGIPTQPAPLKPWKQVAEESNIFSLPPEQRIAEYDKWSAENVAQGIKDGDFDSRDTFDQFKLFDIRTRKNLASDDIIGPSDDEVIADYNAFKGALANTQAALLPTSQPRKTKPSKARYCKVNASPPSCAGRCFSTLPLSTIRRSTGKPSWNPMRLPTFRCSMPGCGQKWRSPQPSLAAANWRTTSSPVM